MPAVTLVTALLTASACAGTTNPRLVISDTEREVVTVGQANATQDAFSATDQIGLTLLTEAPHEGSTVVSPASLVNALSMPAEGTRGQTADQFGSVLGASGSARTDAINALLSDLEVYVGYPAIVQDDELPHEPIARVANQVVLDDNLTALPEFLGVLVARWNAPLQEHVTGPQPFTLASGTQVGTDTMAQTSGSKYGESQGWQAVRLPYSQGFHTDILLPPMGCDPASITLGLEAELQTGRDAAEPVTVNLMAPSLEIDGWELDLQSALDAAGIAGLFEAPDLSEIRD